jgi:hypothetical protein
MSLVVLRNPPGSPANLFTCAFDKPLTLSKDSKVELVSCVFESAPVFEIGATNNTCSYRLRKYIASTKTPQPYVTATVPEGVYSIAGMREALERALNAVVPESGASIHVNNETNADGLFSGFSIRFEVGYKTSPPTYQFDSTVITQTQTSSYTKLEFKDVGAAGWDNKHAWSSEQFTRGRGFYTGVFTDIINARCVTLSEVPLVDGDTDQSPYMSVGISTSGALQYTINGTQTIVGAGTWTPSPDDVYGFSRTAGTIRVVASNDLGVTYTTIATNTASDIPLCLFPGAISYDKSCEIRDISQTPDGNVYGDGVTVGTRANSDAYFKANPGGSTLYDDGVGTIKRSGGGRLMYFDAGTLAETLGFSPGPIESTATMTYTYQNGQPIDPRAEHPALVISLPQLQLDSRNGATSLTGSILGVVPRLTAVSNGNLVFEPRLSTPVRVSYSRPTPVNTITVEISQLDGTPAILQGISVVTIWVS